MTQQELYTELYLQHRSRDDTKPIESQQTLQQKGGKCHIRFLSPFETLPVLLTDQHSCWLCSKYNQFGPPMAQLGVLTCNPRFSQYTQEDSPCLGFLPFQQLIIENQFVGKHVGNRDSMLVLILHGLPRDQFLYYWCFLNLQRKPIAFHHCSFL